MRPPRQFLVRCACVVALIAVVVPSLASAAVPDVPVLEGWRHRWGDSPLTPDGAFAWASESGEGAGWLPTQALGNPPNRNGATMLWLSVPIPEGGWTEPALYVHSVAHAFEVYANGARIYANGEIVPNGREHLARTDSQIVRLPKDVLGKRVLVRVQSSQGQIGIAGDARVGDFHPLFVAKVSGGMAGFVLGVFLLSIGTLFTATTIVRRRLDLVPLGLFAICSGLLTTFMSGLPQSLWGMGRTSYLLVLIGAFFLPTTLAHSVGRVLFEMRNPTVRRTIFGLYALAAVASVLLLTFEGGLLVLLPAVLFVMLGTTLVTMVAIGRQAWRGNGDARILVAGVGIFFLIGMLAGLNALGVVSDSDFGMHWGLAALTLSLLGIVGRRAAGVVATLRAQTNALVERQHAIQRLAGRMGTGATELLAVVQQLRESAAQQNAGVSRQASALHQADATVKEIRHTSQVAAEKALFVAASASEADEAGQQGTAALDATLRGLEAIRAEVGEMARRIQALEARTREIAGIVDTVKGLADQSNMLALNAAIEAVRSGEHGKGFGVVAREVRSLADQSIEATSRIREILESVGTSMRETAELSRSGEERVRASVDEVRASGEQLKKLALIIGETGSSMRSITTAVAQQDEGTSQIAAAITDLAAQMEQTLAAVRQTEQVSRSVEDLARGMSAVAVEVLPGAGAPTVEA